MVYDKNLSGAIIQSKRLEARLTQENLAEQVGCSVRHIVNIERGAVGLSIESMLKICTVFKITPNELLLSGKSQNDSDIDWLVASLQSLSREQCKTAISIVNPYIEYVSHKHN